MPLPDELLQLAEQLSKSRPPNLTQATFRRAISTAYYSVFHLLAEAAADRVCQQPPNGLRDVLQRHIQHAQMKSTAQKFSSGYGSLPKQLQTILPSPIPPPLAAVAKSFASLQDKRHQADYSRSQLFTRLEASSAVAEARQLFNDWTASTTQHPEYVQVFLISLFFDFHKTR
jgi:uncharacterized protein (UPF0332 family)